MFPVAIDDLKAVIETIMDATFSMRPEETAEELAGSSVSSLVGISGAWNGAVLVGCAPALAVKLASVMFGTAESELARDHLEDTMGEMANMIGGNLKSMLPPANSLSLPTVVEGHDYRVRIPGATAIHQIHMRVGGEAMKVTVLERRDSRG